MKLRKILGVYALITLFTLMVYGTAQHLLRTGANMLPATSARYMTQQLARGLPTTAFFPALNQDMPSGGAQFFLIADKEGKPLIATYTIGGKPPSIPKGAYDYAAKHGENRLTWQPKPDIREAIIIRPYKTKDNSGGFVVSGTSLLEPETSLALLTKKLLLGWLLTIGVASVFFLPNDVHKTKKL